MSEKLGMKPYSEKISERLAKLETKNVHPDGLTKREIDILRLLTTGQTNQEIAAELSISEKTVANHVTNIFSKTRTSNRTEAAQYATKNGISSE